MLGRANISKSISFSAARYAVLVLIGLISTPVPCQRLLPPQTYLRICVLWLVFENSADDAVVVGAIFFVLIEIKVIVVHHHAIE